MMMMGPGPGFFFFPPPLFVLAVAGVTVWVIARSVRRRRRQRERYVESVGSRSAGESSKRPTGAQLYRLARDHHGILTVSTVVVEMNVQPDVAEQALQDTADGLRVQMDVRDDGRVLYRFTELLDHT